MTPQCGHCGYRLLVLFSSTVEMQELLRAAGWICAQINGNWHFVCPSCRKEITYDTH